MKIRHLISIAILSLSCTVASAQQWTVSTNAIDWINFGTINAEASVAVHRNIALNIGVKYNPWTFGNASTNLQKQNRQRMFYAGVKWYPWFIFDGWHFDVMGAYKEYNSGGIFKQSTEEGDAFGGGLGFGYTLPVHKNLNIEFGAGFWMGAKTYIVYSCPHCGKVMEQGTKFFIMPNNITVGATWVFGKTREQRLREKQYKEDAARTNYVER